MKKSIILLCLIMSTIIQVSAQTRIGVYTYGVLSENYNTLLGDNLVEAFTESNQYIAVNRSASLFRMLQKARSIQEKGHIDQSQILSTSKEYGETQICAVDVIEIDYMYVFRASLLNATTNEVLKTASAEIAKSELGYTKILETAQKLSARLIPGIQQSGSDLQSPQATSDMELARRRVEENRIYDISYAAFKQGHTSLNPSSRYYINQYDKAMSIGHWMWTAPPLVALGVGIGVGESEIDKELKLPIIFGAIGASILSPLMCYCVAAGFKRKAWKEYRKPYDDAVKDLEKVRKYQQRASLELSPAVGYDWAGASLRITIH